MNSQLWGNPDSKHIPGRGTRHRTDHKVPEPDLDHTRYLIFRGEEESILRIERSLCQQVHVLFEYASPVNPRFLDTMLIHERDLDPSFQRGALRGWNEEMRGKGRARIRVPQSRKIDPLNGVMPSGGYVTLNRAFDVPRLISHIKLASRLTRHGHPNGNKKGFYERPQRIRAMSVMVQNRSTERMDPLIKAILNFREIKIQSRG